MSHNGLLQQKDFDEKGASLTAYSTRTGNVQSPFLNGRFVIDHSFGMRVAPLTKLLSVGYRILCLN